MSRPRLILCSGAEVDKRDSRARGRHIVRLDSLGPQPNTHLRVENVSDAFARHLPDRLVDLLEIAAYVYVSDCGTKRDGKWSDDATEPWSRDFLIVVPVRDLEFWQRPEVQESLVEALEFLADDTVRFEFVALKKKRPTQEYLQIANVEESPFFGIERVTMFSGGLDSLAGLVEQAASGGKLVAVSHRPVSLMNRRQRDLFQALDDRFRASMMHVPVWVNKHQKGTESSQRARTFLFASLGAAVASVVKAGGIRFYENGVTSLNWPVAQEVLRSRASRSTHPRALLLLERFLRLVLDRPDFAVDNPFAFQTKTEVVASIAAHGATKLIAKSCSCAHTMFRSKEQWHCGTCSQCIDRRVSILAAGLGDHDPATDYETAVFTGPRKEGYEHDIGADYARLAGELREMSEAEIGQTYNLELARAVRCYPKTPGAAEQFIDAHKRHAEAVCGVLAEQVSAHSDDLVAGRVDRSSLLAMVAGQEHFRKADAGAVAVESEPVAAAPQPGQNAFRKGVGCWGAGFGGQSVVLTDWVGVRYIVFLLQHQGRELDALALVRTVRGDPTPFPNREYSGMSAEQLEKRGLRVGGFDDVGEVMDPEYEADCRKRLKEAQEDLQRARLRDDKAAVAVANELVEQYRRVLSGGVNIRGRRRKTGDPAESARIAVTQAIGRVLAKLRDSHPALYEHLDSSIHTGSICCYRPSTPTAWTF